LATDILLLILYIGINMGTPDPKSGQIARSGEESSPESLPWTKKLQARLIGDIDTGWTDTILLGCYFISGMVDSAAFNTWKCFVGMQTGGPPATSMFLMILD
jgi:hypothetical protein